MEEKGAKKDEEEISKLKKKWKKDKEIKKNQLLKNKEQYWKNRDEILKIYENQYIAFSNGSVIGNSDSSDEIFEFVLRDPTIFTTKVGCEDYKPSTKDIWILTDLKSIVNGNTIFLP